MTYLDYLAQRLFRGSRSSSSLAYPLLTRPSDLKLHDDAALQPGISRLRSKIDSGAYKKIKNNCLCGNQIAALDVLVARLDMHAIPHDIVRCGKCGLIRSDYVLDVASNADYYRYEYREILGGGGNIAGTLFDAQLPRGVEFIGLLDQLGVLPQIASVMEMGCGSGGVLFPFHEAGKQVTGYDYDDAYLQFGRSKGMTMVCLGEGAAPPITSTTDLLILSHVLEHFLDPKSELVEQISKVTPGKYLLVEVPGIFSIATRQQLHGYPVRYFQFAHVFQYFYREFLEVFYVALGLEIVHGDETCTFVLKKPLAWVPQVPAVIFKDALERYPDIIDSYLKKTFLEYRYRVDRPQLIWFLSSILQRIGLRRVIKRILHAGR